MGHDQHIGARIARMGRTSFTFVYEIFRADSDALVVSGQQVWVNTSQETRRPMPLLESFRARVLAKEGDRVDCA